MKAKIIFMLLVTCLTVALPAFSVNDDKSDKGTTTNNGAVLRLIRKPSDVKRSPSRDTIILYYGDNAVSLQSTTYNGELSIDLVNYESGAIETIPSITIGETVALTLEAGIYQVSAYSSTGAQYSGELEVY